jgi:hypothetical protein
MPQPKKKCCQGSRFKMTKLYCHSMFEQKQEFEKEFPIWPTLPLSYNDHRQYFLQWMKYGKKTISMA